MPYTHLKLHLCHALSKCGSRNQVKVHPFLTRAKFPMALGVPPIKTVGTKQVTKQTRKLKIQALTME
jgi:hypothetical protein